ncbi:MAG: hypothetical protein VX090_13145, partial [Pseudomonadota bacterium]|nr:hypothetical protein [Pseudomonadota bacterium]
FGALVAARESVGFAPLTGKPRGGVPRYCGTASFATGATGTELGRGTGFGRVTGGGGFDRTTGGGGRLWRTGGGAKTSGGRILPTRFC